MKKLLILPILALSSIATDSVIAGTMGPAVAPPNWTGFYIGGNGGAGLATAASTVNLRTLSSGFGSTGSFPLASHELNGFWAGGQAGYNFQSGNILLGLEGDGGWANIRGSAPCIEVLSCSANIRWTADATARLGILPTDSLLVYIKGGVAWAGVNYNLSSGSTLGFNTNLRSNLSTTKTGGMLGIGTEYQFASHWTTKIEYNYDDYGTHTNNFVLTGAGLSAVLPVKTILQMHAIKVGINYRV